MTSRAASKKGGAVAPDEPVTIPLFVPHHYIRIETRDGHIFVVDRNVAIMSRLLRDGMRDLYRIALDEDDSTRNASSGNLAISTTSTQQQAARGSVKPSVLQETLLGGLGKTAAAGGGAANDDYIEEAEVRYAEDVDDSQSGGMVVEVGGSGRVLHILADGDIDVLVNSERTAAAAGQLPIVYCLPSTTAADGGGAAANSITMPNFATSVAGASHSAKGGSKQLQQAQLAHEQALLLQQQRAMVEEAIDAMKDTPLTHIRLTKLNSEQFEVALRFMQYKYKVDHIADGPLRPGFRGFIPGQPSYPLAPVANALATQQSLVMSASSSKRKSVAASSALGQSDFGGGTDPSAEVDPITGAGVVKIPDTFSSHHVMLLAVSALLQL